MTKKLLIVGAGYRFEDALEMAKVAEADRPVESMELTAPDNFNFQLPDMSAYPSESWDLFVALDERGLNLSRHQLVAAAKARGYKLHRLVSPGAVISSTVTMGENAFIAPGVIVGRNTRLGLNVVLEAGVRVGEDCKIGNGAYLQSGAIVQGRVELGDYVTLGLGAVVQREAKIGRYSDCRRSMTYQGQIPDRTFYLDVFENPVSIVAPL